MNLIIIFISFQIEEDEPMLSYDTEGNVNGGEFRVNTDDNADDEDDEESEEEKSAAKGDDESDEDEEDGDDEEEEADDEEKDEESDDNDSLNDLRLKDSDQEEEASDAENEIQVAAQSKPEKKLKATTAAPDFKQLKDMMEQARKELPFTFAGKIQDFSFGPVSRKILSLKKYYY